MNSPEYQICHFVIIVSPTRLECSTVKRQILINLISFTCHNYMNSSRWVPVECFWTAEKHFIWWLKCINITWNKNFLTLRAHKFQFHQITTAHILVFTPYNIHHMQQGVATVDMKKKNNNILFKKSFIKHKYCNTKGMWAHHTCLCNVNKKRVSFYEK